MILSRTISRSIIGWVVAFAALFIVIAFVTPQAAKASEGVLSLSPTNQWVAPGGTLTVDIVVNSRTRVNAVEGTVTYPKNLLTATAVSTDGSAITLWAEEPMINADQGTVRFAGGTAGGRTGGLFGSGHVLTITFNVIQAGMARVTLEDSSVLAHDGLGTPVTGVSAAGRYTLQAEAPGRTFIEPGDLIKLPDDSNPDTLIDTAVYYYGYDGLRYVFPNSQTYFTWYNDFSGIKNVGLAQMGTIGIGGNVTYRPGVKMIKIDSDPKVYAVGKGGLLHWVSSEALAVALYGATWNTMIHDVPDSFFTNYRTGADLVSSSAFIPTERAAATGTITVDKGMSYPLEVFMNSDGSFTPAVVTVGRGNTIRFTNTGTATQRVKAAASAGLAGLDSAHIPPGLDYVYRFDRSGSFGILNAGDTSKTGTVVVQ
jgi:plastocyanin